MKTPLRSVLSLLLTAMAAHAAEDTRVYEMRTYYAPAGKLDALHSRFRDHTVKLFEKHGITNIGYWVPIQNPDQKIVYVLAYPTRDAREQSWKAFLNDPDWKKAHAESEKDGKLVAKIESVFMNATDYSPEIKASKGDGERVFELRTYTTVPGRLDALNSRFRDHTLKLFEQHGMTNIFYWKLMPDQPKSDVTLIYLLAHKSQDAAKASFGAFRQDPKWTAAREASEKAAGGSLTVAEGGVKSEFLKATGYSPTK
jgi:hypothetical protein